MQLNSFLNRFYNYLNYKKVYLVYIPLVFYWVLIFIATTIPIDPLPKMFKAQDKLEHFCAYFALAILLFLTLHFQKKNGLMNQRVLLFTVLLVALYGAVDELHQFIIPGRYCDLMDWVADVIGGLAGISLMLLFLKKYLHPSQSQ